MKNIFTKHPNSVGESYLQHFVKACGFSVKLILISVRVFIHAIFPFLFAHSTSNRVSKLNDVLQKRSKTVNDLDKN